MKTKEISNLQRIRLFAALAPAARKKLQAVAYTATYVAGQLILGEGELDTPVFFVLEGLVRVYRTGADGREQTLLHVEPGEAFNLPTAFAHDPSAPASAVAVSDARLLAIPAAELRRVAAETPEIALALLADLSDRLRHLSDLAHDLSLRSVRGRLARFLLAQAQNPTPTRWTHEQIAAQIGSVREVVSRTLRSFVKEGLIGLQRQRIVVLDPEALRAEAEG